MRTLILAASLLASTALAQTARPSDEPAATNEVPRGRLDQVTDPQVAGEIREEASRPTRAAVTIGGRRIDYVATPGTLTLRDEEGQPIASMFYVSYTVPQAKGAKPRPLTFLFNGGPGSSSMWLHIGSFAPMKVDTPRVEVPAPVTARFGPNPNSLIDKSDLVFMDAIGTGYSRPLGKAKGPAFWGVDQDIDAFSRGIQRYLTVNDRWSSPKFILGESYGTLRAGGLSYALQSRGVALNGVMLLSSIMNYGIRSPGFDNLYVTYLPSYAATAWYHNRVANKPASLDAFLAEVRAYARGPYLTALTKGDDLPEAEKQAVASQVSAYTGLSVDVLMRNDLRVDLSRFRKDLLRDQRRTVGRLDSRFTGIDTDAGGDGPEYDAADTALSGAYIATINSYLKDTLGYQTPLSYRPNFYQQISPAWNWTHRAPGENRPGQVADTALDLAAAMRQNPHLKVLSLNGYYDMATPFFGAEYDLKHMQLDPSLRGNLTFTYYPSGHMIYIEPGSAAALKRDLDRFYDSALR